MDLIEKVELSRDRRPEINSGLGRPEGERF